MKRRVTATFVAVSMVFLVGSFFGLAVFFLIASLLPEEPRTRRLLALQRGSLDRSRKTKSALFLREFLGRLGRISRPFLPPGYLKECQELLNMAGGFLDLEQYLGLGLLMILLLVGVALAVTTNVLVVLCTLLATWLGLRLWLRMRARRRRYEISRSLPFALDLLTICGEAGLGFDSALSRYIESSHAGPLRDEFIVLLQDMRSGKSRYQALKDFAARLKSPEIDSFCLTMMQADRLGTSIGTVMRMLADQTRIRRIQQVEGLAMRAPVKMLFPLLFFIFPAIFIIFFGPILLNGFLIG